MIHEKNIFSYDGKYYHYSDIIRNIQEVGITKGDTVFVHSDVTKFGKLCEIKDKIEFNRVFLNACLEAVGTNGTLIVPTFTYSFGDSFNASKIFDVNNSPSILNPLTELARKTPGFIRSEDPMLSVVAKGPKTNELFSNLSNKCLGKGSVWQRLHKNNAHNLMLGFKFDSTFIHYIEERFRVPYRLDIELNGKLIKNNQVFNKSIIFFARNRQIKIDYSRKNLFGKTLEDNLLKISKLGSGIIMSIKSDELFSTAKSMLEQDIYSLVNKI